MLSVEKSKTALLVMDVQNDIVHMEGKYKDFGCPAHAKERDIFGSIKKVLTTARNKGIKVIHVKFGMRDFKAETAKNNTPILSAVKELKACNLNEWGGEIHEAFTPVKGEEIIEKIGSTPFTTPILKKYWMMLELTHL